jgi:uncharacterized membrane protein YqjE
MDSDRQQFAAVVQAVMAFMLIGAVILVVLVILLVISYLVIHKIAPDQALSALLNTGVNALINLGSIGVGFWLARHRAQQANGADDEQELSPDPTKPAQPAKP